MEQATNQPHFQPTKEKSRINSLDVIRGIALLGILLMNINGMGLPYAYSDPSIAGGSDGLNLKVWIANEMLFEGTMRGLFTLLFGAGVILLTNRLKKIVLTNYLMHSVITTILFYGFGFALFGTLQRYELYYIVAGIWVFQLIFSPIWLMYFHYGPVEWLWRSLTYQKKQVFKI